MAFRYTWYAQGGREYTFEVVSMEGKWNNVPGVYIFVAPVTLLGTQPLYVGQTESFSARMPTHERWKEAQRKGATKVHAMVVQNSFARLAIEDDLIKALRPPMNKIGFGLGLAS